MFTSYFTIELKNKLDLFVTQNIFLENSFSYFKRHLVQQFLLKRPGTIFTVVFIHAFSINRGPDFKIQAKFEFL